MRNTRTKRPRVKTELVGALVPEDFKKDLQALAEQLDTTQAQLVRDALFDFYNEHLPTQEAKSA
jgi:predicted transcriptional regulator